jgi:propanol-preferring alcohol dehydrogenase
MRAMVLEKDRRELSEREIPAPVARDGQVLIRVKACAVCRTDLHILDRELKQTPKLPLVPGHEIVGIVEAAPGSARFREGQRVGVPWLGWTCGTCGYCTTGRENLCNLARFTGFDIDGGYAEYCVADARYCFPIAGDYDDPHAAPLLCAGLIGYRALRLAGEPPLVQRLGLYGFGAAAHVITQVAVARGQRVFAFTRPGDTESQSFARAMGAEWAGANNEVPTSVDAAIIFAPVGELVTMALSLTTKGGIVVCAGIHMSDIPSFRYELLWGERTIRSVANLTRRDGEEFLALAPTVPVRTEVETFPLDRANDALSALRSGRVRGAAVLIP